MSIIEFALDVHVGEVLSVFTQLSLILRLLLNLKVHSTVHKTLLLVPTLNKINTDQNTSFTHYSPWLVLGVLYLLSTARFSK